MGHLTCVVVSNGKYFVKKKEETKESRVRLTDDERHCYKKKRHSGSSNSNLEYDSKLNEPFAGHCKKGSPKSIAFSIVLK